MSFLDWLFRNRKSAKTDPGKRRVLRNPEPGQVSVNHVDGAEMVFVPPGEFTMGTDESYEDLSGRPDGDPSQRPAHRVRISTGMWVYKTPVTNAQYQKFIEETLHPKPEYDTSMRGEAIYSGDNQPVVAVSWFDAIAYAKWVDARLPTEAEWEYVARGPEGRIYPWGNQEPNETRAVFGKEKPEPVGQRLAGATPLGILDLGGNVKEWCYDWEDENYYKVSPLSDPGGPDDGRFRIIRGSCWEDLRFGRSYLRQFHMANFRLSCLPNQTSDCIGFRPVRSEILDS